MASHGKQAHVGTPEKHVRFGGVGTKGARSEDAYLGFGGVVRRSEDTNLGVGGIVRSEYMNLGVGGVVNVDAKGDKSYVGHATRRSSGTYRTGHRHEHGHGQKGMGNGQSQSIRVMSSTPLAIAPSPISRTRICRIDDPQKPRVPDLTSRDVPV